MRLLTCLVCATLGVATYLHLAILKDFYFLYQLPIMFIYTICPFTHTDSIVLLSVNKMLFTNLSATVSTTIYTLSMKSYVLNEELIKCVK